MEDDPVDENEGGVAADAGARMLIATGSPEELGTYMRDQSTKWAKLIRDAKIVVTQ